MRRTPLFSALTPQVLGSGLMPDLHSLQRVLWDTAENVSFQGGRIRRRRPNTEMVDFGADPIRGLAQQRDSNGVRWIWAASGGDLRRWYGPPAEDILLGETWQEDTGLLYEPTFWDLVPNGDDVLINTGQGQIRFWDDSGSSVETIADSPSDILHIRKIYNFLVAFGYSGNGNRVGWSGADDYETWTAGPSTEAGALSIAEFDTRMKAVVPLGDSYAMYAADQMALLNYVSAPFYFGYKMRLDGIGAIGKRAVAGDGKNNVGVGRAGIWWTDGYSFKYMDEGYHHDYLQENVNWEQGGKIVACRNDFTGCFDFSFPMGDSLVPNEGWSFDPRVGSWHKVPAFSLKDERRLFNGPLVGTLDGSVELEQDANDGLPLSLITKPVLCQLQDETGLRDVHNNVQVDEVVLLLQNTENVEFRWGSCQEPDGTFTWTAWIAALDGAKTYRVPKTDSGRSLPAGVYHKLELRSTAADWSLDFQGFMLFGTVEGTKRGN